MFSIQSVNVFMLKYKALLNFTLKDRQDNSLVKATAACRCKLDNPSSILGTHINVKGEVTPSTKMPFDLYLYAMIQSHTQW